MDTRIMLKRGDGGQSHATERPCLEPLVSRYIAIEGQTRKLEECQREQDSLAREIKYPNTSRPRGAQAKLIRAIQKAADKCHRILVALRLLRKGPKRNW